MTDFAFERAPPPGGYRWWYLDAVSDDGAKALTIIAFVGSVFSPYYAWAGRKRPEDHCALNVALYGGPNRWAMTERRADAVERAPGQFQVGPSALTWDGTALTVEIAEIAFPRMVPLRGRVRVVPEAVNEQVFDLDAPGRHRWRPIAPSARAEVVFERPALSWSGPAYIDSNEGDEPLEAGFRRWDWSRAPLSSGSALLYDATRADGSEESLALRVDRQGAVERLEPPARRPLATTLWRIRRGTQSEGGARVAKTLEDTPFYARSLVDHRLFGEEVQSVHESLDLTRFRQPWVKWLLPFRMPRR